MTKTKAALFLTLFVLGAVFFSQSFHVQAQNQTGTPVVSIDPALVPSLPVNSSFTVYVRVENAVGVEGVQVQFTYSLAVLNATGVVEGPFLPSFGGTAVAQLSAERIGGNVGAVNYSSALVTGATASGSGILLNVTFTVLSEASTNFHLVALSNSGTYPGTYFLDISFNQIVPTLVDGTYGSPVVLTASPITLYVGDFTTLTGKISGTLVKNVTSVDLMYSLQGSNWTDLRTVPTNSSGFFSSQWASNETGFFEFRASYTFAGLTSYSLVASVTVQPVLHGYGIYVLYAFLGVIVFIAAVLIVARVRRGGKQAEEPL
jgi:hypothetical protein